jgi:hypothetical protein
MFLIVKPNSNNTYGAYLGIILKNTGWKWVKYWYQYLSVFTCSTLFFQDRKNPFLDIYVRNGESLNRIFTQTKLVVERLPKEWNRKF